MVDAYIQIEFRVQAFGGHINENIIKCEFNGDFHYV